MTARARNVRTYCWVLGAILLVIVVAAATVTVVRASQQSHADADGVAQPFAADSPFLQPISPDAKIDPTGSAMVNVLARQHKMYAGLKTFGIPIYDADRDTPRSSVRCEITTWGPCPFDGVQVPIPADATPQSGSDGAMVVVDSGAGKIYEFWRLHRRNGQWSTAFGALNDFGGSGWGGASTGSGASRLAGVVRVSEISSGVIGHALALQSDNVCSRVFRAPALKTDGTSKRADCVPEGARLRLDPAVDLSTLKLTNAERTVATAMQKYGGYIMDVADAPLSVSFERDNTASAGQIGQTYTAAGLHWDYDGLGGIPWNKLQVLR